VDTYHDLLCTPSPAGLTFECEQGCGRLLVVDRDSGSMTVLGHGDPYALHRGGTPDIELSVRVENA
jgi:hypothetical protein